MPFNLPILLTWFRIVLIPCMVVSYYLPFYGASIVAAALFAAGAITDWLDGYFARRWGQMTRFGAFLDPVADKLTVGTALFLIVQANPTPLMAIVGAIIVGREIAISALREWMADLGERGRVKVAGLGKIKTIVQMVAITILLYRHPFVGLRLYNIGAGLLIAAAVLTLWSGVVYVIAALPVMRKRGEDAVVEVDDDDSN
jgi:CDP-diacylglycerol--glycerol-3-phosphate 3-phosphatidyltransferase